MTLREMFSLVYQLHMPLTKLKFEEMGTNLGLGPFKNRGIYNKHQLNWILFLIDQMQTPLKPLTVSIS